MSRSEAIDNYSLALRQGQKEYKERLAAHQNPYPAVLDEILQEHSTDAIQSLGVVDIPTERIVGTKSAGRISAFSAGFYPLLRPDTEFAVKWIDLCEAHLDSSGIRDPISCYEYMGLFYVQEGNKRVSVLKHFGAPRIPGNVQRILPPKNGSPESKAYYEFLDFYKDTGMYDFRFRQPGRYAKLLAALRREPGEEWTQRDRRTVSAYFQYFKDAFYALGGAGIAVLPEEALLRWLQVHSFPELGSLSSQELKKTVAELWSNIQALGQPEPVEVRTEAVPEEKGSLLTKLISPAPEHLHVAFVHMLNPETSEWVRSHEQGRLDMQEALGSRVTTQSYFDAFPQERAEEILEQAVADGAEVLFTTSAQLSTLSLKLSVKYPRLRVYNCSVDMPYPSMRTYYARIYEGKFITGAVAGAFAQNDSIGYVGAYPILGELASINAFALGAQMTNPRAKIRLEWSCVPGDSVESLIQSGVKVISNRDIPANEWFHPTYGTYSLDDGNRLTPLASPCWMWGSLYTRILNSIFSGAPGPEKNSPRAVNYWWGMRSGAIDVKLADTLPDSIRSLVDILRKGLRDGSIDPFRRRLVAQDGTEKSDGSRALTPEEILHMDYLCQGIQGSIPTYDQLLPRARPVVRLLGLYRDTIPPEKEDAFQ